MHFIENEECFADDCSDTGRYGDPLEVAEREAALLASLKRS